MTQQRKVTLADLLMGGGLLSPTSIVDDMHKLFKPEDKDLPICGEAVILWPDGDWCYYEELHEFNWKSDDYVVLPLGSDAHQQFLAMELGEETTS